MLVRRIALALGAAVVGLCGALPASAQFYLKSHDFSGVPVTGADSDVGIALPDATDAEQRAALVWNMRAALNVAALQCQFEPTLLSVDNYNAMLLDHQAELKDSFDTLTKYFARTNATKKAGQNALDQFGTRTYSSFVTVGAQYGFCQTAGSIGRDAIFAAARQADRRGAAPHTRVAQQPEALWRAAAAALSRSRLCVDTASRRHLLEQEGRMAGQEVRRPELGRPRRPPRGLPRADAVQRSPSILCVWIVSRQAGRCMTRSMQAAILAA